MDIRNIKSCRGTQVVMVSQRSAVEKAKREPKLYSVIENKSVPFDGFRLNVLMYSPCIAWLDLKA